LKEEKLRQHVPRGKQWNLEQIIIETISTTKIKHAPKTAYFFERHFLPLKSKYRV